LRKLELQSLYKFAKNRFSVKDWILNYLAATYGISASEIEKIHVKYFIQGNADWMKRDSTTVYLIILPRKIISKF